MVLHMSLKVNGDQIGYLVAQRVTLFSTRSPRADDICHYEWSIGLNDNIIIGGGEPLAHRYGDGAWALVGRILERAGYNPTNLEMEK